MSNPFEYGVAVTGASFCNRVQELTDLARAMENSERLFLYSERRLGKTSLVLRVLKSLDREQFVAAYVDLWATDNELSFATATANLGHRILMRLTPICTPWQVESPMIDGRVARKHMQGVRNNLHTTLM